MLSRQVWSWGVIRAPGTRLGESSTQTVLKVVSLAMIVTGDREEEGMRSED